MASVTVKQLKKAFGSVVAVNEVDLEMNDREFVVLVGPSGCGKTTILRIIAGLETATSGEVYIGETMVNDMAPKDRDIAMVFQNYALYPHMTVYDNLAFAMRLRKFPGTEIDRRIQEVSSTLGLENLLHRRPKELSGGQQQRVALGRAIIREPQVFLMDEPLSNLDAKLRVQMRAELSRLHNRLKTTTIYVTHDQVEAMTLADRIVVMKDGVINQYDTPLNVYQNPVNRFVAGFIGSPPMNFIDGTIISKGDGNLFFQCPGLKLPVSVGHVSALTLNLNREVILGLRPDALLLDPGKGNVAAPGLCKSEVDVVEPLGSETLLYVKLKNQEVIVAKVDCTCTLKPGENVVLVVDMDKAHYFDRSTEQALL
ncbi:MAG: sn-glycerol-3-phosphate ABC transporter ATP-binding protein UgpC [Bacillota bacterium]